MNYRNRHLEAKILRYREVFPVVLVTGARQVGKSTLLSHLLGPDIPQVVFDPVIDVGNARQDPEFFIAQHPPPILLDEIQYAPELLSVIKRRIDRDDRPGQYFLTGSQNLALLRDVSESLAGRAVVLDLGPMTLAERHGLGMQPGKIWLQTLLDAAGALPDFSRQARLPQVAPWRTVFDALWRGGYPQTLDLPHDVIVDVLQSYVRTYVERDIRTLASVQDQQQFSRFLALCAAMTAQEINHSQLGREIGVTPQTAARWLNVLKATFQWMEIPPYHGNAIKRISGKPKGYFSDTGLAAFLQRISSPEALSGHPLFGPLFETHVVMDIHRQFQCLDMAPQVHHWRTHAGAEVDLLLERDGIFWPVEIKTTTRIAAGNARGIAAFRTTYPSLRHGPGVIIAPVEQVAHLRNEILVVPYDLR
ncbi:MAG: ATP-binding protein [Candidatus Latescibacteria bacterium]|nr:ATP-binding protein [Candidatus Latescibacterota bacterium]